MNTERNLSQHNNYILITIIFIDINIDIFWISLLSFWNTYVQKNIILKWFMLLTFCPAKVYYIIRW